MSAADFSHLIPHQLRMNESRFMLFVDGEGFTARYQKLRDDGIAKERPGELFHRDTAFWPRQFRDIGSNLRIKLIRRHYYTSAPGDETDRAKIVDDLKAMNIESAQVFHRSKSRGSKRVDISLTTDMLIHSFRNVYDAAILVAGDEDFVPVIEAIKNAGKYVVLWFWDESNGLSPHLKRAADFYADISIPAIRKSSM